MKGCAIGCTMAVFLWGAACDTGGGGDAKGGGASPAATAGDSAQSATSAGASSGGGAPSASTGGAGGSDKVPAYEGREGAVQLGVEFREAAAGGTLKAWLGPRAAFPFDVDGKAKVRTAAELDEALARDVGDVAAQVKEHTTCVAISREELLGGSPWHFLDRLGERPPKEELERDLDRLGLRDGEWLVNCHKDKAAGYSLIVSSPGEKGPARIRAFRN